MFITGTFTVELNPQQDAMKGKDGIELNRLAISKTYHGDLDATSTGEMLSAVTPVKGSAGYVALEQVSGKLDGKTGTFVLQHYGVMDNGGQTLQIQVVPDSGTGELEGLTGTMAIIIDEGVHRYEFNFGVRETQGWT
ncbi:DUF3224 domain-containing protein [Alteromonas sp. H39]|uniref:DUF3224 domain-containing protein n=1 Tax=Alteromonas sp. H39 TaxID=3389876 RepID=UPI0039DFE36B